jgi:hypothetical protein
MAHPDVHPHRPAIEIADVLRQHGDAYRACMPAILVASNAV